MDYITAKDAARKWKLTPRRVQSLCSQGRVKGAKRFGKIWLIPKNAGKPQRKERNQDEKV